MARVHQRLLRQLQRIVGEEYVVHHPHDLLVFEYDGSVDRAFPTLAVLPGSPYEAAEVVRLCAREGVPVVPRGSGTGLSGGAIAVQGGVQLVLTRLRRILYVDRPNRLALVEPGVINLHLDQAARQHGLRYAPDPSSQRACSLGGNVAENAGGPHCLAYGVTTNHVLGIEVVLEDGTLTWLGGRVREVPGYDLRGAFIGSEGMFAVATQAVVRLLPEPEAVTTLLGIFPDVPSGARAVAGIIGGGMVPAAIEMIDALTIRAVQNAFDAGYPEDAGSVLLVEVEGLREEVQEEAAQVEAVMRETGAREVRAAQTPAERERLWIGRKGALGALGTLAPNYYLVDGVVPRSRLPEVLPQVEAIGRRHDLLIANVFHAGDGNLHPCILFDERQPGALERVIACGGDILEVCVAAGGTLSGEHGIGLEKQAYLGLVFNQDDMEMMRRLWRAFAPVGRFNPGKVFPGSREAAEAARHAQRAAVGRAGAGAWV